LQITLLYLAPSTLPALRRLKSPLLNQLALCVVDGHPERLIGAKAYASAPRDKPWSPVSIEALGPMEESGTLEPVMITMAPGGRSGQYPTAPAGEKFALIVAGEVTLLLGDEKHVLRQGDAITFAAASPHQWENHGAGPAQVVLVAVRFPH
jgi:quercetin dioxygenase-like cupin family protein